jgi:hypothetical protein
MWMSVVCVQAIMRSYAEHAPLLSGGHCTHNLRGCLNAITTSFGELQKHVRKQGADVTGLHAHDRQCGVARSGGSALSEHVRCSRGMYRGRFLETVEEGVDRLVSQGVVHVSLLESTIYDAKGLEQLPRRSTGCSQRCSISSLHYDGYTTCVLGPSSMDASHTSATLNSVV